MRNEEQIVTRPFPRRLVGLGSADRLGELYAAYSPDALRLAFLLTQDSQAAGDLVQDAFIRLLGRFADLRERGSFESYLRRTVVNLSIDRLRRLRAERARDVRQAVFLSRERASLPDVETRQTIGSILRTMPPRQQAALVLRFYEDLTERQIAETLRCSVPAVKGLLERGLKTLGDRLGGEEWT
jgi:RNA polymerase sigma factor (sigma-70 family)